jgi:hypothetical protein
MVLTGNAPAWLRVAVGLTYPVMLVEFFMSPLSASVYTVTAFVLEGINGDLEDWADLKVKPLVQELKDVAKVRVRKLSCSRTHLNLKLTIPILLYPTCCE